MNDQWDWDAILHLCKSNEAVRALKSAYEQVVKERDALDAELTKQMQYLNKIIEQRDAQLAYERVLNDDLVDARKAAELERDELWRKKMSAEQMVHILTKEWDVVVKERDEWKDRIDKLTVQCAEALKDSGLQERIESLLDERDDARAERDRYCKQSENYSLELLEEQQKSAKLVEIAKYILDECPRSRAADMAARYFNDSPTEARGPEVLLKTLGRIKHENWSAAVFKSWAEQALDEYNGKSSYCESQEGK